MTQTAYNIYREIINYYTLNKKFPNLKHICEKFKKDKDEIFNYIKELEKDGLLVKDGKNYVVKNNYRIPKQDVRKDKISDKFKFKLDFLLVFKFAIFVIGCIATFMSMYFTYFWFKGFFNNYIAFMLAIAIVGFSVIAFESIIIFKYRKNFGVMWLFIFLWFIVLTLSMTTTIAGQVNKNFENTIKKKDVKNDNNVMLYTQLKIEIDSVNIDLANKRKDRDSLNNSLIKYSDDQKKYNSVMYQIAIKDKDIEKTYKLLESKNIEFKELIKNSNLDLNKNKDNLTFYQWASSVLGIPENVIEFFLGLFFALFLDIISPISFSIILMLDKKKVLK